MFDSKKFFGKKERQPMQEEMAVEQTYVISPSVPKISKQIDTVYNHKVHLLQGLSDYCLKNGLCDFCWHNISFKLGGESVKNAV